MLKKINLSLLILFLGSFLYSVYQLVIQDSFYPFSLIAAGSLLSLTSSLSVVLLKRPKQQILAAYTFLGILNAGLLIGDYFSPSLLENTWNFSFAIVFLILFALFLNILDHTHRPLARISWWIVLLTGVLLETVLIFELSSPFIHSFVALLLAISTVLILIYSFPRLKGSSSK